MFRRKIGKFVSPSSLRKFLFLALIAASGAVGALRGQQISTVVPGIGDEYACSQYSLCGSGLNSICVTVECFGSSFTGGVCGPNSGKHCNFFGCSFEFGSCGAPCGF